MNKIRFYPLGGILEEGKNLFVVEVDKKLFILDAGDKVPSTDMHGVDTILPDVTFLNDKKSNIVGLFLSHAHNAHIGSAYQLIKKFNVDVYASKYTLEVLKEMLKYTNTRFEEEKLHIVNSDTILEFDSVLVRFFNTIHNIPESLGINIKTKSGNIVYTANFNFDQNSLNVDYAKMYTSLTTYANEGVLMLLPESMGSMNSLNRGNVQEFKRKLHSIFSQTSKRIIVSIYSSDIKKIKEIIDLSIYYNKKVCIYNKKTEFSVNKAIELGYIKIKKSNLHILRPIEEGGINNIDDLVVIVTGKRQEPYYTLQRMSRKIDRYLYLEETDTICVLNNPYVGIEKIAAKTLDIIYKSTSKVYTFSKDLIPTSHASKEEIKEMINILKPKYIVPIIGEYRHMYNMIDIAKSVGYTDENIIIMDQGHKLEFINGEIIKNTKPILFGESLIDGKYFGNIGDIVMNDRSMLSSEGLIIISAIISVKDKSIVNNINITSRGFIFEELEDQNIEELINEKSKEVISRHLEDKQINWSNLKTDLRQEVNQLINKVVKRQPVVIPVIMSQDKKIFKTIKKTKSKEEKNIDNFSLNKDINTNEIKKISVNIDKLNDTNVENTKLNKIRKPRSKKIVKED